MGYALWVTLKHRLKRRPAIVPEPSQSGVNDARPFSPLKPLALLSALQSAAMRLVSQNRNPRKKSGNFCNACSALVTIFL